MFNPSLQNRKGFLLPYSRKSGWSAKQQRTDAHNSRGLALQALGTIESWCIVLLLDWTNPAKSLSMCSIWQRVKHRMKLKLQKTVTE